MAENPEQKSNEKPPAEAGGAEQPQKEVVALPPKESEKMTEGGVAEVEKEEAAAELVVKKPPPKEWVTTGIPGFDELFEKGIPWGTNVLVSGSPGTGKTIFCLEALYNSAKNGRDCLYITFEELPRKLKHHIEKFGWPVDKILERDNKIEVSLLDGEKKGKLVITKLDPFRISRAVEAMLAKSTGELLIDLTGLPEILPKDFKPYLVALDSISALESAFVGKPESYRIYIEQLFRLFEKAEVTTLLITEIEEGSSKLSHTGVEEFLADGVLVFYNFKLGYSRVRGIEILKMRGAKHEKKIVPMKITDKGIVVYPDERIYESVEVK